ncbi:apolipoprotein L3-like [Pseudorasbora parva]|uniref:apolipoprotein L3-like n=1 Tax=Pseudorasbora parva TaxID=51549 RepID=UPI00351F3ADE
MASFKGELLSAEEKREEQEETFLSSLVIPNTLKSFIQNTLKIFIRNTLKSFVRTDSIRFVEYNWTAVKISAAEMGLNRRTPKIFDDLRTKMNRLNLDFDRNHQKLTRQIKVLKGITDEFESMHKNTTVGSLVGSSIGAAGGITSIAGLALAPFTFGASLALTVGGAVVGAAGGLTGIVSNSINTDQQTNLRETIEKITSDFLNTIKVMTESLNTINNSTEDIRQMVQQEIIYIPARMTEKADGVSAFTGLPKAETHQKSFFEKNVVNKGLKVCSGTVKTISSSTKIVKNAHLSAKAVKAARLSSNAAQTARVSAQAAKATRALRISAVTSAVFVVLDVVSIVQDSIEISEINQSADPEKAKKITSETVKFIHQMRETVAQFQKILDEIKEERDIAIKEFENEIKCGTSFLGRQNRNVLFVKIIVFIIVVLVLLVLCFFLFTH